MSFSVQFAALIALVASVLAVLACVLSVRASRSASRTASEMRSMLSMQGELAEMHEVLAKLAVTVKRIAGRQAVTDHRERKGEQREATTKEELRRQLGLVPGKPAPHA